MVPERKRTGWQRCPPTRGVPPPTSGERTLGGYRLPCPNPGVSHVSGWSPEGIGDTGKCELVRLDRDPVPLVVTKHTHSGVQPGSESYWGTGPVLDVSRGHTLLPRLPVSPRSSFLPIPIWCPGRISVGPSSSFAVDLRRRAADLESPRRYEPLPSQVPSYHTPTVSPCLDSLADRQ